jgi:di/tricarboxylate transporter
MGGFGEASIQDAARRVKRCPLPTIAPGRPSPARLEAIPIPITGLVGLCLCVILNVASADDVFGSVFDSTILLFIGSFIIAEEKRRLGRLTAGERNTLIAFGVAITLWTLPGLVGLV